MTTTSKKRNSGQAATNFYSRCCRRWSIRTAAVFIIICLLAISLAFGVLTGVWKPPRLTTTVTAITESFRFRTPNGRQSAWSLPPGKFSILGTAENKSCLVRGFEAVCQIDTNTRLVVDGPADVLMQVSPTGGWTMSIGETKSALADIRLYDLDGALLIESTQLMDFQSNATARAIRFPFVADSAILGADLFQSMTIDGSLYDLWQPVLLSGDVTMIAANRPSRETYKVLDERLDMADVLHIGDDVTKQYVEAPIGIWGMVTVGANTSSGRDAGKTVFQVVLHTAFWEVWVTRFGAPDGHVIRASNWSVLQKWPNGQKVWVLVATAVLLLGFILQVAGALSSSVSATDKKTG